MVEEKPVLKFCRVCGRQLKSNEEAVGTCILCQTRPVTIQPMRPFPEPAGRLIGAASFLLGLGSLVTYEVTGFLSTSAELSSYLQKIPPSQFFLTWEVLLSAAILGLLGLCIRGGRALGFAGIIFAALTFVHLGGWVTWITP